MPKEFPHAETAKGLAAMGRYGDDRILHVSQTELDILDAITPGGLTTNPETGEKEAWFWLMPLLSGLGTWAATGDFKEGLKSGLLGLATGGIGSMLSGASGAASGASAIANGLNSVKDAAGASSGIANVLKGVGSAASTGASTAGAVSAAQAAKELIPAAASGIDAVGKAAGSLDLGHLAGKEGVSAFTGNRSPVAGFVNGMLGFARDHPMMTGIMASMLPGMLNGAGEQASGEDAPNIPDQMPSAREHIPFDQFQYDTSPSTYRTGDPMPSPDDIYNYGQYHGEREMFNPPAGPVVVSNPVVDETEELAAGGRVKGPGTPTSDSVPAINTSNGKKLALSNDEYVLPAFMVDAIGGGSNDRGAAILDHARQSAMSQIRTRKYGR